MDRKPGATADEKRKIVVLKGEDLNVVEIAKKFNRSRPFIYKVLRDPFFSRSRSDKGTIRRVTKYEMQCIKRSLTKMLLVKSKAVFEDANVLNVPKTSRNMIMNKLARCTKPR